MKTLNPLKLILKFSVLLAIAVSPDALVPAATLTVSNPNDSGPGSLRQTIQNAAPGDTINFSVTGAITLTNGELVIGTNLTINGPGPGSLTVQRSPSADPNYFRIFHITGGAVRISGLTVSQGRVVGADGTNNPSGRGGDGESASGGGILNTADLTLVNCRISGNSAAGGGAGSGVTAGDGGTGTGGGIWNSGSLLMTDCVVSNNAASGGDFILFGPIGRMGGNASGGGVFNAGTLALTNCEISGNLSRGGGLPFFQNGPPRADGGSGDGGGIANEGALSLLNCRISGNSARGNDGSYGGSGGTGSGGGVINRGTLLAIDCWLGGNSASGGYGGGGGGYFGPNVSGGSGGDGSGGGIYSSGDFARGTIALRNCTLNDNLAAGGGGGGAGATAGFGSAGASGRGGAIWIATILTSTATNCTLSGNTAQGGAGGSGFAGRPGGQGGFAFGGGIATAASTGAAPLWIVNCTVTANAAIGGSGDNSVVPRPPGNGIGGGMATGYGVYLHNSIVAANRASSASPDLSASGGGGSQGFNLVGDASSGNWTWVASDLTNLDARLGPLRDNGGPTLTHALLPDSPAIDAGTSLDAPAFDQRGFARPQGLGVDIGAFEATPLAPVILAQSPSQTVTAGTNLTLSATVTGTVPLHYQWYRNDSLLNAGTDATLQLNHIQPADAGAYSVVVSNYVQSVTSAPVVIVVNPNPLITVQPRSESVSPDGTAAFNVAALGLEPLSYQWQFNGKDIPGENSPSLVVRQVQPLALGDYTVVVSNTAETVSSAVATLSIWPILTVSNTNDSGPGSLRQAILDANIGGAADRRDIVMTNLTDTIILNSNLPAIAVNTTIAGPGANRLRITGSSLSYLAGTTNTLSGLTITNGGGIGNAGALTVIGCAVMNNPAGRGISNSGDLTILGSTVARNQIIGSPGGGVYDATCQTPCPSGGPGLGGGLYTRSGTVRIINSTFSGNRAIGGSGGYCWSACFPPRPGLGAGGGIFIESGTVTILNCTIANNQAYSSDGTGSGSGIFVAAGTVSMKNSLVAGNIGTQYTDVFGAFASQGYNLIGYPNGSSGWIASDLTGLDSKLGPLQDNGGSTFTMALLPDSPAIDAGDDDGLAADQRGVVRPQGPGFDIGAFELPPLPLSISNVTVTEGNYGITNAVFTVTLATNHSETVSVDFATADGSAIAGNDYVATNGTLFFLPGETNKTILVAITGDIWDEGNETFFLNLSHPTNIVVLRPQVQCTIVDDDTAPAITLHPQSQTVSAGTKVTLSVMATSLLPIAYQWRFNGMNLMAGTNSTLVLSNAQFLQSGSYDAVVADGGGATLSATAFLTVLSKPIIIQQPESQTAVVGDTVVFNVTAVGTPPLSYRWRRNGSAITPYRAGGSTLTLTNVQLTNAGNYSVVITNPLSAGVLSSSAVLIVLADSDGDHLPDVWETAYGLNPNDASDAAQDADSDGQTNQQEFLAGTDPMDPTSHLQFDSITFDAASDRIWLRFFAAANRTYTVQSSALVDHGIWTRLVDVTALATNRFIEVSDSVDQPANKRQFYRLVAPRAP